MVAFAEMADRLPSLSEFVLAIFFYQTPLYSDQQLNSDQICARSDKCFDEWCDSWIIIVANWSSPLRNNDMSTWHSKAVG